MSALRVCPDSAGLARAAEEHFINLATGAFAECGRFLTALSGGSILRATCALLATEVFAHRIDSPAVHLYWGEKRCAPPYHLDSNCRTVREALLDHLVTNEAEATPLCAQLRDAEGTKW